MSTDKKGRKEKKEQNYNVVFSVDLSEIRFCSDSLLCVDT